MVIAPIVNSRKDMPMQRSLQGLYLPGKGNVEYNCIVAIVHYCEGHVKIRAAVTLDPKRYLSKIRLIGVSLEI